MASIAYDPNVDYMQLILDAEKAGNKQLAAQYEAQRNAKIADLNATGTNQWNAQASYNYTQTPQQNSTPSPGASNTASAYTPGYTGTNYENIFADTTNPYNSRVWIPGSGWSAATTTNGKLTTSGVADYKGSLWETANGIYEITGVDANGDYTYKPYTGTVPTTKEDTSVFSNMYEMGYDSSSIDQLLKDYENGVYGQNAPNKPAISAPNVSVPNITTPGTTTTRQDHDQSALIEQLYGTPVANNQSALIEQLYGTPLANNQSALLEQLYGTPTANNQSALIEQLYGTPLANDQSALLEQLYSKPLGSDQSALIEQLYSGQLGSDQSALIEQLYGTPLGNDQSSMIEALYAAQQEAALAELKKAYDQNIIDMNAAAQKVPGLYQAQRNRASADAAVNASNFNEMAASSGLSSGASAQAQLARNNQLQSGLSSIAQAEADAMANLETERAKLNASYQNDVAQAIAAGDAQKAQALYAEAIRMDEILVAQAQQKAQAMYNEAIRLDELRAAQEQQKAQALHNEAIRRDELLAAQEQQKAQAMYNEAIRVDELNAAQAQQKAQALYNEAIRVEELLAAQAQQKAQAMYGEAVRVDELNASQANQKAQALYNEAIRLDELRTALDQQKAQALYGEAVRVDELLNSQAYKDAQLSLQRAELERALANDAFDRELILAEQAAKNQQTYVPSSEPSSYMSMDANGNWQVSNPTAEQTVNWNTQQKYGTQYVTAANKANEMVSKGYSTEQINQFLATLLASGSLTREGVEKILGN